MSASQALAFLVAALALGGEVVHAETIRARFNCDDHKSLDATFDNGTKPNVRLSLSDGRRGVLPQARSGSGARYANDDERIVFWNKGDTAFIEENGSTTYHGCVAKQ